jgi:predicted transcriptional regulator of viral defense system
METTKTRRPATSGLVGTHLEQGAGVVRWADLELGGLNWRGIKRRIESGELRRIRRGVYESAASRRDHTHEVRLALAARAGAYFCAHESAAFLHGLLRFPPQEVHIGRTTTSGERVRESTVQVHRLPSVDRATDLAEVNGVLTTTVARTLIDMAACARTANDRRLLRFAVRAALKQDDRLARTLRTRLRQRARKRGTAILTDALSEWAVTGDARSLLEVDFVKFCRDYAIPLPRMNMVIAGSERDAVWLDAKVMAEIDTRTHHDDDVAFQEDRDRRNAAVDAGWRLVQITPRSIGRDAPKTAALLLRLLDRQV